LVCRVARDRGYFAREGLHVVEVPVISSRAQFGSLVSGEYGLVLTSPDNVLAYRLDPANPLGGAHDVRIVAAVDRGLGLSLIGAPGVRRVEDLRGEIVAVDIPDSGFAFVLYHLLAAHGLTAGVDYQVVAAGTTPRRRDGLLAGEFAATLLGAGHDVVAVGSGCHRLVRAAAAIRPFLGTVLAGMGSFLEANSQLVDRFLAAWSAAAGELIYSAGRGATMSAVETHLNLSGAAGQDYYSALLSPHEGLIADGGMDLEAFTEVARLRAAHGRLGGVVPEPGPLLATGVVDKRCLPGRPT
jgi:ABC-type nitrate/sulfonate/bicarbonate transport system substrate-binding protein